MANYKRSAQTKDAILETASRLFYEKGYTSATVREICAQSNISVSRINYHFSSKADLAGVICGQFLRNFIKETVKVLEIARSYPMLVEAIALRFIIRLMVAGNSPASRFYMEVAREGILTEFFSTLDRRIFERQVEELHILETDLQDAYVEVYAKIYASALSAVIQSWDKVLEQCGGDQGKGLAMLQNIFVGLFMQMINCKHEIQQKVLELSEACYRLMEVEIQGLTQVNIRMPEKISPEIQRGIVELSATGME